VTGAGPPIADAPATCVYVVDDDDALRDELCEALTAVGHTVRTYTDGAAFLAVHDTLGDGCIVLDVNMPGLSGREVQEELRRAGSRHQIVMLTGAATVPLAVAALQAGAADFIEKPLKLDTLIQAVARALARLRQDNQNRCRIEAAQKRIDRLSDREHDVLCGLVLGLQNKIIAYRLGLSIRTVEAYRAHVMTKLEVPSLSEAIRLALDAGVRPVGPITRTAN
jgi:two-component system response regulator FixJ